MNRSALILACGGLLIVGCDRADPAREEMPLERQAAAAERQAGRDVADRGPTPAKAGQKAAPVPPEGTKTRIVGALLDVIDNVKVDSEEVKDGLKNDLRKADGQLHGILGDNSREKIMRANKKPVPPIVGHSPGQVVEVESEKKTETEDAGAVKTQ